MSTDLDKDLVADARSFCEGLTNVFLMKRRDPQTRHLLDKAKWLIEKLMTTDRRARTDRPVVPPKPARSGGGMGQLWVKLDELKRENEELRRQTSKKHEDKAGSPSRGLGPVEVVIADLQRARADNDQLRAQLEQSQSLVKELELVNSRVQDEFRRTKISQDLAHESLEKIKREHKSLVTSLTSVKTENDTLKLRLTHSVKPIMRPDTRFVENINEKCRPSNVALLYNNLESQEWVDAKEALEDAGVDDEAAVTQFLCDILMTCYSASCELLNDLESAVAAMIVNPALAVTSRSPKASKHVPLPDDMMAGIKDLLRQNLDNLDVDVLSHKCKESIVTEGRWAPLEQFLSAKAVHRYVEQSAAVTWQMTSQQMPMWLSTRDTEFDDAVHRLWWSCSRSNAKNVDYFIWPALYDYKNGSLMVKGCVFAS